MKKSTINRNIKKTYIADYKLTEFGMADLFTAIFGEDMKYIASERQYMIYRKNGIWAEDNTETAELYAERLLTKICPYLIKQIEDKDQRKAYGEWVESRHNNSFIGNILKGFRRKRSIATQRSIFDQQKRYFKLQHGIYDIEKMRCIADKREYLITKMAGATYNDEVKDDTWKKFIMEIMDDDEEMYEYLLRIIGYAMQGNPVDHCMFLLYGEKTRNGKSTFVEALLKFFGDYGTILQPESISTNRNSKAGSASPDIIKLRGARFVSMAEAVKDLKLDVALIKTLTGMDHVSARKLYSDYEEFVNSAVIFMHLNHLPIVDDKTLFASKRVIVIPFDVKFSKKKIDTRMKEKLTTESALAGLLNEVIRVQKEYKGICVKDQLPKKIRKVTKEFEHRCDPVGYFIDSCLIKDTNSNEFTKDVFKRYVRFANQEGLIPIPQKTLTIELGKRGLIKARIGNGGFRFRGISIVE